MKQRTGEKVGWTGGWMGGFIWVFVMSVVFLFQGKITQGVSGMALTFLATIVVVFFAPWRFPSTPYWKLMLAHYGLFLVSVAWVISAYGGIGQSGFSGWDLWWLLPLMLPFASLGKRTWDDSSSGKTTSADAGKPRR